MTGKTLTEEQKIGAAIAIVFVMIYSVIDDFLKKMKGSAGAVAESATALTVITELRRCRKHAESLLIEVVNVSLKPPPL